MIKHKKDEHNIIYSHTSLEQPIINAGKGKGGGKGEGSLLYSSLESPLRGESEVREDGEDVKKKRSWNHPNFKEREYDSYFLF